MKYLLCRALVVVSLLAPGVVRAQASGAQAPAVATAAKHTYFVKLIPPRPTFATDMTDAEGKLMEQHADYWLAQFDKGKVLILGPVLDPKGAFGMVVIETATEAEARELAMNDPTVKAGLNRIEVSPMRVFRMRK